MKSFQTAKVLSFPTTNFFPFVFQIHLIHSLWTFHSAFVCRKSLIYLTKSCITHKRSNWTASAATTCCSKLSNMYRKMIVYVECMCSFVFVCVCASELKRIRDRKFSALDISFWNYFRKNLNMYPKAKNTLPLQYSCTFFFSLSFQSFCLFLVTRFSTIAYSLLVMSTKGALARWHSLCFFFLFMPSTDSFIQAHHKATPKH